MTYKAQITGMRGVYLVAAELSGRGFIVSPTSRNTFGADLLVADQSCRHAYSVQVKTNARNFSVWYLNAKAKEVVSDSHIYVLVNLRKGGKMPEYFVLPSRIISKKMKIYPEKTRNWYWLDFHDAEKYRDNWRIFGSPNQ